MNTKYTEYMVEKVGVIIINNILIMLKVVKTNFSEKLLKSSDNKNRHK